MDSNVKKIATAAAIIGVAVVGGVAGAFLFPTEVPVIQQVEVIKEVKVPVEVVKEVPVEVIKTVDNPETLAALKASEQNVADAELEKHSILQYVDKMEGNLVDVYEESDSVEDIADVIFFDMNNRALAVDGVKKDLFNELDKVVVTQDSLGNNVSIILDEDDMKRLSVDSDFNDLIVTNLDVDGKEASYRVSGSFEQGIDKFDFVIEADLEDNKFDDMSIVSVIKRA